MISRPELRWTKFWWTCDWLLVLSVVLGSLVTPDELDSLVPSVNDKIMHCSAYFLMGMWFAGSMDPRNHRWLAVGLITMGGVIEILQYFMGFGRDADWRDFLANSIGVLVALALARAGLGNWMAWVERRLIRD